MTFISYQFPLSIILKYSCCIPYKEIQFFFFINLYQNWNMIRMCFFMYEFFFFTVEMIGLELEHPLLSRRNSCFPQFKMYIPNTCSCTFSMTDALYDSCHFYSHLLFCIYWIKKNSWLFEILKISTSCTFTDSLFDQISKRKKMS